MTGRGAILLGMGLGALWAIAFVTLAIFAAPVSVGPGTGIALALAVAAMPLAAAIGVLAAHRFRDPDDLAGATLTKDAARIDQAVLTNGVEQTVLAMLVWPAFVLAWGGGAVIMLAVGFTVSRFAFWIGYRIHPTLRAFGFAGGFYGTLLAGAAAVLALLACGLPGAA
ncbi:MAG: MAPEG family protein [Pseudomonadota bacterium]